MVFLTRQASAAVLFWLQLAFAGVGARGSVDASLSSLREATSIQADAGNC